MKLNYKRTLCVGFAFFLICAFWQAYDTVIPLILTNKFGMSQGWSGLIMAADNILALFLIPLFGSISDKCKSKSGKRTPFIVVGTIIAAVSFVALAAVDGLQIKNISDVSVIDDKAALGTIYDAEANTELKTSEGESFVLSDKFTREQFCSITSSVTDDTGKTTINSQYTNYVVPARQSYVWAKTCAAPGVLTLFIGVLMIILLTMATFRSPAVALMPDVTVKPLRSKANAIINLMGSAGGIIVLLMGKLFATSAVENSLMSYVGFFMSISGLMLIALVLFRITVNEPKFAREMHEESIKNGIIDITEDSPEEERRLTRGEKISLIFILLSVVLWFMGYNAVTSKYSVYASNILHIDYNMTMLIAQAAAIVSYLPVGMLASKLGRKKTILAGIIILAGAVVTGSFIREGTSSTVMSIVFALAGIGWATINVNSFPMVVELAKGGNVGKYTGFYYTASMAAQIVTPILSGALMDKMGMTILFPYAAVFVTLAFVTMLFVKHGDSLPQKKQAIQENFSSGD